jgi:small subunit ribosomal protein S16
MKKLGRLHRPFFRICAIDAKKPRDGRVLEELGTYDPMVPDTDARTVLQQERVAYWLGVGAQPSDKCKVLIKKYGPNGTHLKEAEQARSRLALPKVVPPAPKAVELPKKPQPEAAAPEAPAAEPAAEGGE